MSLPAIDSHHSDTCLYCMDLEHLRSLPVGSTSQSSSPYEVPRVTTPQTWDAALDSVLAEMRQIMIERQAKYGPQNIIDQGLYGVITRASADKVARIKGALTGRVVKGEVILDRIDEGSEVNDTFEDGLLDAANYFGPIALMVKRGWWELPRAAK